MSQTLLIVPKQPLRKTKEIYILETHEYLGYILTNNSGVRADGSAFEPQDTFDIALSKLENK